MSNLFDSLLPQLVDKFSLFPPELVFLTIVLVIIPTILASLLRFSLYRHLRNLANKVKRLLTGDSPGIQPEIVRNLEKRFGKASKSLEIVNTTALVDGAYSQEKFHFLGLKFLCEQWDYFCRVLPNLLLAFGLLGTFLGITLNLYNIAQVINQANAEDVGSLIQNLQGPLQSMGIAFITSLFALVCSSFLTVVNLRYNTGLAKITLISSLEDYLDNIYQPSLEGYSRLDQAVNRMVDQQNEFLTRFHEKVGQILESTLGRAVEQMVAENTKSQLLGMQVYERLMEASGSLSAGASTFRESIQEITKIVPKIAENTKILASTAIVFKESTDKLERSNFTTNFEKITVDLVDTQKHFSGSASLLSYKLAELVDNNQKTFELADKVYTNLDKFSNTIQESSTVLLDASQQLNQSKFSEKLASAASDLAVSHNQFAGSVSTLNNTSNSMESAVYKLRSSTETMTEVAQGVNKLSQQYVKINELLEKRLNTESAQLSGIQSGINQVQEQLNSFMNRMGKFFSGDNQ